MRKTSLALLVLLLFSAALAPAQQEKKVFTNRDFPQTLPAKPTPDGTAAEQGFEGARVIQRTRTPRQSWRPLEQGYFADGNNVRWLETLLLRRSTRAAEPEPFDVTSFKPLGCGFVKDQTGVYVGKDAEPRVTEHDELEGDFRVDVLERVDLVDPDTLIFGKGKQNCTASDQNFRYQARRYAVFEKGIAMVEGPYRLKIVGSIGTVSFEQLNCSFVRVADRVYWMDELLPEADSQTFRVLWKQPDTRPCYARDGTHVYLGNYLLKGADPDSFQVVDYAFAFDQNTRYEHGRTLAAWGDLERSTKLFEEAYRKWKLTQQ